MSLPASYKAGLAVPLVAALGACAGAPKPPVISYDDPPPIAAVKLPDPQGPIQVVAVPTPLPLPGQLQPLPPATPVAAEPADPTVRVAAANAAARVQPGRGGFLNAIQQYPYSDGALYQVYAAPGQVTDIALEPGEELAGSGPVAAGDTVRWIIGDTTSGSGAAKRVHILLKPTQKDLATNLVINTDRRTYHLELGQRRPPTWPRSPGPIRRTSSSRFAVRRTRLPAPSRSRPASISPP